MRRFKTIVLFLIIAIVLMSCATNLRAIKRRPRVYVNKLIAIRGKVVEITFFSPKPLRILKVEDKRDRIYVLTVKAAKKNRKKTFKGEVIPIKRPISKIEATYIVMKVAKYLVDYNLASFWDSIKYGKIILQFLKKVTPKEKITLLMLDKKIKCYLLFNY